MFILGDPVQDNGWLLVATVKKIWLLRLGRITMLQVTCVVDEHLGTLQVGVVDDVTLAIASRQSAKHKGGRRGKKTYSIGGTKWRLFLNLLEELS